MSKAVETFKNLVSASKNLSFNSKAGRIYDTEIRKEVFKIRKVQSEGWKRKFKGEDIADPIMDKIKGDQEKVIIDAAKNQIKYFTSLKKPHTKEVGKGLILPGTALAGIVGTSSYIKTKNRDEV